MARVAYLSFCSQTFELNHRADDESPATDDERSGRKFLRLRRQFNDAGETWPGKEFYEGGGAWRKVKMRRLFDGFPSARPFLPQLMRRRRIVVISNFHLLFKYQVHHSHLS